MTTLAEVKITLELDGDARDSAIADAITAASRAINNHCHRELTPKTASATRTFAISETRRILDFERYDLRSATTVTLNPGQSDSRALTADVDFALWPLTPDAAGTYLGLRFGRSISLASGYSYEFGSSKVSVDGAWGAWDTADVPEDVRRVCNVVVGAWLDRAVAEYGEAWEGARNLLPGFFSSLAIPKAAWSMLQDLGLKRWTTV